MTSSNTEQCDEAAGSVPTRAPMALHAAIRETLMREIASGLLKPHDRLPSEAELMRRFGVSRITVRQALGALAADGMIFALQGKGSFVSLPKAAQTLSRLEGFAEAMGAAGHEVWNDVVGFGEIPASREVAERLRLKRGAAVTEIRRVRHLDRAPISYEVTYLPPLIGARLASADLARRDIFTILENDLGRRLGRADLTVEAALASGEVAPLLGIALNAPVLRIERLTHDAEGTPIDFEYLVYRGDTFRYRLTVDRNVR
ncbi:GntR family transcriptional regulator [Methylobacterium sp. DB0501]|nr:GntR family transcriptional regulator [Methylobacterium sp. DB0501]